MTFTPRRPPGHSRSLCTRYAVSSPRLLPSPLCGRTVEFGPAQIAVCDMARQAGAYTKVSCPLCEAARFIDSLHIKGTWIQPAFIGGESW